MTLVIHQSSRLRQPPRHRIVVRPRPGGDRRLEQIEAVAGIGWYELDVGDGRWTSSPGLDRLFGIDAAFDRSVEGWVSLVHPEERDAMATYFAEEVLGKGGTFDRRYRIVRADTGAERWVHGRGELTLDGRGRPVRMVGTIADITELQHTWDALEQSERRYAAVFEGAHDAILIAERESRRFLWVNEAATRLLGYSREELLTMSVGDIHPAEWLPAILGAFESGQDQAAAPCRRCDGTVAYADIRASTVVIDGIACVIGFFVDVTAYHRITERHQRLAAAVEHASDSVVITDPDGAIEYVNPAFERATGYRLDDVVGRNPRILKSGTQGGGFYRAMWRRLASGRTWTGTLVNRRRDGSLFEEEATISPILDATGTTSGYVGVKRDVTAIRAAESALAAEFRERSEVAAALARLQPAGGAEATAAEICGELLALPGVSVAAIFDFPAPGRAVTLAVAGPSRLPFTTGDALPEPRARYLYERARQGPWAEAWAARPEDGDYGRTIRDLGIRAVAYSPIRNGEGLLGVVAAATSDDGFAEHLVAHMPAVGEFAATASALLSGQLEHGHRAAATAERIRHIMATAAYRMVFQPIISLAAERTVGCEALARFDDGTPPSTLIAGAHAVGLGVELELALVKAAIEAARPMPPSHWLSVNLSPAALLRPDELAAALGLRTRPMVLEITEHVEIADYPAVRAALAALGPDVTLAVDDTGAGFASLRHVVELRPQYLKVDRSLVGGVDQDLTREAMVAGLARFAERAGCQVIAEGIETPGELAAMRGLGIALGQGFLLGRPGPVSAARRARR